MLYNTNHNDASPVCQWRETIGWRTRKRTLRKKELLSLYNALNMSHYENPDDLEIITLDNALFHPVKPDNV